MVVVGFEDETQKVPAPAAEGALVASSEAILALTLGRGGAVKTLAFDVDSGEAKGRACRAKHDQNFSS